MTELVFLKLGGSLITDKSSLETPRLDVINRVAQEIRSTLEIRPDLRLVIGHGSGSFGHFAAKRYGVNEGFLKDWSGYAFTSAAAQRLNRLVTDRLLGAGVAVVSVQPSASALCREGRLIKMAWGTIKHLLDKGLIPLVYGDVSLDEEQGCAIVSTEQVFVHLAEYLHPSRVVIAGDVHGVYMTDPNRSPDAQRIPRISVTDISSVQGLLSGAQSVDVTGGMLGKVMTLAQMFRSQPDLEIQLVSGTIPGMIGSCLLGEAISEGTALVL